MYQEKAGKGARIAALLLDALFLHLLGLLVLAYAPNIYFFFLSVIGFLYYGILEGCSLHASLGKYICGLIVVDETYRPITYQKSFIRSLARCFSGMILGIGYFMGLADPQGQTLHDKMVHTWVVQRRPVVQPQPNPKSKHQPPHQKTDNRGYRLMCITGSFAGQSFFIHPHGTLMGRDATFCNLVFPDDTPGISRRHCKIQLDPQTGDILLCDLGSSYGTFLGNGTRIPQGQPVVIHPCDEFYLAGRCNLFRVEL